MPCKVTYSTPIHHPQISLSSFLQSANFENANHTRIHHAKNTPPPANDHSPRQSIKRYSYKRHPSPLDQAQAIITFLPLSILLHRQPLTTEVCPLHHLSYNITILTKHLQPSLLFSEQQPNSPQTQRKIHNQPPTVNCRP